MSYFFIQGSPDPTPDPKPTDGSCGACGYADTDFTWCSGDGSIGLPTPPDDLEGVEICRTCYRDGQTMEARIRAHAAAGHPIPASSVADTPLVKEYKSARVVMPNGTDGCICAVCNGFFAYTNPNQPDGSFLCCDHRTLDF